MNCLACLGRVLATQTPNIFHPNENLAVVRGWEGRKQGRVVVCGQRGTCTVHLVMLLFLNHGNGFP